MHELGSEGYKSKQSTVNNFYDEESKYSRLGFF